MVEPIHRAGIGRLDIAQCTYTSLGPGPHTGTSRARRKCAAARSRFGGTPEWALNSSLSDSRENSLAGILIGAASQTCARRSAIVRKPRVCTFLFVHS